MKSDQPGPSAPPPVPGPGEFSCDECGNTYRAVGTLAEAMARAREKYGTAIDANGPPRLVCSKCASALEGAP